MFILDTWSLTLDIWHWYLTCYHLTPDTWQLTCYHSILDICYHLVLTYFTWCCDTWLDTITPDTYIILHIHDYHFDGGPWHDYYTAIRHIVHLNSSTPVSPALMSPTLLLLLIARSYRRPAEHPWCRDDEDVSHDHASVWQILNETKCHTEQSATPHGHL